MKQAQPGSKLTFSSVMSRLPFLGAGKSGRKIGGRKPSKAAASADPLADTDLGAIGAGLDAAALPEAVRRAPPRLSAVLEVHPTESPKRLLPIVLSARRAAWRRDDPAPNAGGALPDKLRRRIFSRDRNACRYCGIRATSWQEIHRLDGNTANDAPSNLVTACHLCRACFDIGQAGVTNSAVLVWLPWISQARLNNLLRAIWVAEAAGEKQSEGARALFQSLREAQRGAIASLGTSDPLVLANAMLSLPDEAYSRRGDKLADIRLLNIGRHVAEGGNRMREVVDFLSGPNGPFAAIPTESWEALLEAAQREIGGPAPPAGARA